MHGDLIVIDVESNGPYGQPFCVGAILMDHGGRVLESFLGRCSIDQVEDDYVLEHVIPALSNVPQSYDDLNALEIGFIEWYATAYRSTRVELVSAKAEHPCTIVDVGFPVDCNFLYRLGTRDDNHGELWKTLSPYPLLDLASILVGVGVDPDVSREEFAEPLIGVARGQKHNPVWDAEVSGLCAIRSIRMASKQGDPWK